MQLSQPRYAMLTCAMLRHSSLIFTVAHSVPANLIHPDLWGCREIARDHRPRDVRTVEE